MPPSKLVSERFAFCVPVNALVLPVAERHSAALLAAAQGVLSCLMASTQVKTDCLVALWEGFSGEFIIRHGESQLVPPSLITSSLNIKTGRCGMRRRQ